MITKIFINPIEQFYAVVGNNFPPQIIHYTEMQEWNTVGDHKGMPLYDIQIDDDNMWDEDLDPDYSFQYVELIEQEDGDWEQGEEFTTVQGKRILDIPAEKILNFIISDIIQSK